MIGGNYTETTRDAWLTVPGRDFRQVLDSAGRPVRLVYSFNNTVVFVKHLEYEGASTNPTHIYCDTNDN